MEMDMDGLRNTRELLDKSVKLLESSWANDQPKFRHHLGKSFQPDGSFSKSRFDDVLQSTRIKNQESVASLYDSDLSLTMLPGELKTLRESRAFQSGPYVNPAAKSAQNQLFTNFLEIWQRTTSNEADIFRSLLDFIQSCTDAIDLIRNSADVSLTRLSPIDEKRLVEIESERNTWKLIYSLYKDRILSTVADEEMEEDFDFEKMSEKEIMEKLYKKDASVREWQLVIDWLEGIAEEENTGPGLEGFTDKAVAWENTLHELQNKRGVPYKSTREFITELDPDAPRRQNKHLHDMDQEDEDRLEQQILKEIRCGKMEAAQTLCIHAGQPWRAAVFEGWKLHHDPNFSIPPNAVSREPLPIEGNPNRDIWKRCAWRMCEDEKMPLKARASVGAYCGHLQTLLAVSSNWEDTLWSYLKTMVDIRVEQEIRTNSLKTYVDMPSTYWNNEMSLERIFDEIVANKNIITRKEALAPDHVVQRYVILEKIPELMDEVSKWILGSDMSVGDNIDAVSPHFVRFLTHFVLFLRQIGRTETDTDGDTVIEAYVKLLIEKRECKLVAWYVGQLSSDDQIYYYSAFLEEITEPEEREIALKAATEAGLNVDLITKTVVENIRQQPGTVDSVGLEIQEISPEDWAKISALDWLGFYPGQRTELLVQTNALIAYFLSNNNVLAARMAFNKVPQDTIAIIQPGLTALDDDNFLNLATDNVPKTAALATKEYLCYKAYLHADESFSDWFQHFHHAKPVEPVLKPGYTFMEKFAFEHKHKQYEADLERWKLTMENQTASTKSLLFNVLTFPLGWMVDDVESDDPERVLQMTNLRSTVIPKVTFLLHLVMHSMEDYSACVELANVIAADEKLYKAFSKQRLRDFLTKIAESSLALMNLGKDPLGY